MGNKVSSGYQTTKEKTDVLIQEYLLKKESLETTIASFLKSVDSLRTTAENFASQLEKQHGTQEVSNSEETNKTAIKNLLSSQVFNADLRNSLMKKLAEFFETCTYLQPYIGLSTEELIADYAEWVNYETEIKKLEQINNTLHDEIENLKKQIENDIERSTSRDSEIEILCNYRSQIKKLESHSKNAENTLLEQAREQEKMKNTVRGLETERKQITQLREDTERQMTNLTKESKQKDTEIVAQKKDIAELQKNLKDLQSRNDRLLNIKKKRIRQESLEKDINKEKEIEELQQKYREVKSAMEETSEKLRLLKSKMFIRVNLFCRHRSNIITNIEHELMSILKSKIDENHVELIFEQRTDTPDSDSDPTIALCMTASQIGIDAENAVKGLNMSSKTALLMIHHKDAHALPQQASEWVLTGQGFKKLGCISDMAFLSGKGFFPSVINNNSIVRLVSFIKKEGVQYRKYQS